MPAKYRVDITGIAEVDLEEIWILIAADSVENATRFVTELEAKIGTLEQMPSRCPAIPENALLETEYRHLNYWRLPRDLSRGRPNGVRFAHHSRQQITGHFPLWRVAAGISDGPFQLPGGVDLCVSPDSICRR